MARPRKYPRKRRRSSATKKLWKKLQRDRRASTAAIVVAIALMFLLPVVVDWVHGFRVERRLEAHLPRIQQHAQAQGLSFELVREVVRAESGGDPYARSNVDARGLMQIMPATHRDLVERLGLPDGNLYDPDYNLHLGSTYLRHLMDRFDNDVRLVLAAYHMGPTKVSKLRRDNPTFTSQQIVDRFGGPQTRAYVRKIMSRLDQS